MRGTLNKPAFKNSTAYQIVALPGKRYPVWNLQWVSCGKIITSITKETQPAIQYTAF